MVFASLLYCFVVSLVGWGLGRGKNKSVRRTMGRGKREREAPALSLFPSSAARSPFLFIVNAILVEIPRGSLWGVERATAMTI